MKKRLFLLLGILFYLIVLTMLLQFDWLKMLRPVPMCAVLLGMVILTLCQYKKGMPFDEILISARWNVFFAGLLTSLISVLALISQQMKTPVNMQNVSEKLIPLVFGSILYLIISFWVQPDKKTENGKTTDYETNSFNPEEINRVLKTKGFSQRECHVAQKVLEGASNKEIAKELYISEATVKKHIQNMFKKSGAQNRQDFFTIYSQWFKK